MLCLGCRMLKLWFQTVTSDANIQPAVRQGRLFSPWSHNDHVRCSIFMLWLVKIWQVCSYGKFMQPLETCLFWQLLYAFGWSWQSFVPSCDVFNCLFPLDVQNKIAAIKSLLLSMAGLFIVFLVEKCVACQNWVIRFRMASLSSFTLLNA